MGKLARHTRALPWLATITALASATPGQASTPDVDYLRDIKPILSNSCYACHGPDAATREAGLRLDVRAEAIGNAIVPGDPEQSELLRRVVSRDPAEQMPPPGSNRPVISAEQAARIRHWIAQGADFRRHWAYVAPTRPELPDVADLAWCRNPIDRFVAARRERAGLGASPPAAWRTLVRRLHYDLWGLPPDRHGTQVIEQGASERAYSQTVERLLAGPAFGERLAVYWLDVVRYADSVGIHGDQEISMSPYRDYVLDAFNANLPYDQFLVEQIAGDVLPEPTRSQQVASAFNRLHMITSEGGAQPQEYLAIYDADRVRNMSAALLGTTLGCAQCHDHKFDPFTIKDFYQFAAFFADLDEAGVYGGSKWFPQLPVPDRRQEQQLERLGRRIAGLERSLGDSVPEDDPARARLQALRQRRDALADSIPTVLVSRSVEPRTMRVLPRGNWLDASGEEVQPAFPAALPRRDVAPTSRLSRLDLARWLVDPRHPLVARVFVNRLWALMLGQGIVRTPDDFGSQGELPTHPHLLDWLAVEFIRSGWDIKHMVRLIVSSATYRQSSRPIGQLRQRDPENRLVARQNRFRLDAEMIRDHALAGSGLLVRRVGGPSVKPYQPAGYYAHLNFPRRTYEPSRGADLYRRGLYTHWQRTFLHPALLAFDAPTREECTAARPRSNTPLQSLVLLNDPAFVEAARVLARRTLQEAGDDYQQRLDCLVHRVLQRDAREAEREILAPFYEAQRQRYAADPEAAERLLQVGQYPSPASDDAAELAAWTMLARVVLSLHETITRY
jgi:mono/diheme cytochrome c family protein